MAKRCPPGVLCIENVTFLFFTLVIVSILIFMYIKYNSNLKKKDLENKNLINTDLVNKDSLDINFNNNILQDLNKNSNQLNKDILLDPYIAPLKDDRIFNKTYNGIKVPINVPTQSLDTSYRQIGILTRVNGNETILPLMGRPLFINRDKWNYYTMNDKNNMIKLPLTFKNKSCTTDQGCDSLSSGDTVYVEGYSDIFRVTTYDNDVMRYIPYL
tara:strand:+ start:196 stop:837 length:642 start_codon:yes stop_codon:yes gene_type:complete